MPCEKCTQDPDFHSFRKFGRLGNETLFYTSPIETKDYDEDGTKLANVLIDITEHTKDIPWGWVFDARGMGFHHYTDFHFNLGILQHLTADQNIGTIWVLYPNIWIRGAISCLQQISRSHILHKIQFLEGSNLEVYDTMTHAGLDPKSAIWLIERYDQSIKM